MSPLEIFYYCVASAAGIYFLGLAVGFAINVIKEALDNKNK